MIQIPQQLAAITTSSESFTLIVLILGALFTITLGSYIYTWRSMSDAKKERGEIWDALKTIYENDLKHIREKLYDLEFGKNEKARKDPPA